MSAQTVLSSKLDHSLKVDIAKSAESLDLAQAPDIRMVTTRILLVSAVPPSAQYTGGLMLHSMCKAISPDSLSCFAVLTPSVRPEIHSDWQHIKYKHRPKPTESRLRYLPSKLGALESFAKEQICSSLEIPAIGKEIIEFARANRAELIWLTLEGQTLIRIADYLQENLPLPMVTQIWDPPGWWLRDNNVDGWSQNIVLKQFGKVLQKSQAVAVASWAMEEEYKDAYACNAISVIPGIPKAWARDPNQISAKNETFVIGFAGQFYSRNEWNCLLATLDAMNWAYQGRKIEIRVLGKNCVGETPGPANIRYLGWLDQENSITALSNCDVLYCPYWFHELHRTEARLSFPSKLTTYLAAGKAVLFHGPDYSSPSQFLSKWDAGAQCNDLSTESLKAVLINLISNSDYRKHIQLNGHNAFNTELTDERMRSKFLKTLEMSSK